MERPVRVDFSDDESFLAALESYRKYMISYLEQESHKYPSRSKEGCALRARLYYWRHRDLCLKRARIYNHECSVKDPDRGKRYYAANKQRIRAAAKLYRIKHHDQIVKRDADWRAAHREELNARARSYTARDPAAYREKQRKWRAARRKPNLPVVCPVCGKEFVKHNGFQKCCSPECVHIYRRAYAKALRRRRTPEQIEHYREVARNYARTDDVKAKKKLYAQSERGRAARHKALKNYHNSEKGKIYRIKYKSTQAYRNSRHRHDVRRRARKAEMGITAIDPDIHWKTLAERVGSMKCALCGITCDPGGERAVQPTVDHIIPISKGGTHTWDNVQLACVRCNAAKGATMPDFSSKTVAPEVLPVVWSPSAGDERMSDVVTDEAQGGPQ